MLPAKVLIPPPLLLVVMMWAHFSGVPVLGDFRIMGPYAVDLEDFSPCTDKGSILVKFDVHWTYRDGERFYEGYLTFPYDVDDEELLTTITAYKWGSTGGWGNYYYIEKYDIMDYMMKTFPDVFKSTFGYIGITGKPMPAGTYHVEKYYPTNFKIDEFPELEYGHFKLVAIQSRNGTELCCLQFEFIVKEIPSRVLAGPTRKRIRLFG